MQIIGIFIAMVASVTMFAFIYSYATVEILSSKMREGFHATRMKRDSIELAHTKKLDSLLKMWGER
jgi:hypothetical protein